MWTKRSVTDVARHFADYVNRVAFGGERFVLLRGGREVAQLGPVPAGRQAGTLPELLASLPPLTEEEAETFAHDLAAAQQELGQKLPEQPWDS